MKRFLIGVAVLGAGAAFALTALTAAATTTAGFTVSPWAYACGHTTRANPAVATDPGEAGCPHPDNGGKSYCSAGDTLGTASAAYTDGKLTLTKSGEICDDMASGASILGLQTLTAASADCLTTATCNPGGNLRLNVVDSTGKLHFIGGTMAEGGQITFSVGELEGLTLTSIDVIADNPGTVALQNLVFVGTASPTPTPSATATPTASATAHPTATPAPSTVALAPTGGGVMPMPLWLALVGFVLVVSGAAWLSIRRRA